LVLLKRAGGLLWKWEQMALAANCTMPQKSMIIFERFNSDKKRSLNTPFKQMAIEYAKESEI